MNSSEYLEAFPDNSANTLIQHLFKQAVSQNSSGIAVLFGEEKLTYKELDERSDSLSASVLTFSGESAIIGLSTTRNIEMVIGVLAILKAGKAYLPLDPSYPIQRLRQIIQTSAISACLVSQADAGLFNNLGVQFIPANVEYSGLAPAVNKPGNLAYVLFTSGSTGLPKGVCMGHKPLMNLISWQQKSSVASKNTNTLQFAPLSFDVSFQEIFATLTTGGTLVLINDNLRLDPANLLKFIEKQSINRIFLPFVALQFLAEYAVNSAIYPACLTEVMTAGEQLKITPQLTQFFINLPGCVLYNQYGPTECHVVTQLKLAGDPLSWPTLPPIGSPIDNCEILILDKDLNVLPSGETGELCIAGKSLADGYLNDPALTKEKFVEWSTGADKKIIYRTGDLARYLPGNSIEFLGRKDDQVKIRGYRIELAEVEAALTGITGIKQAVVAVNKQNPDSLQMVAYLISAGDNKNVSAVRTELGKILPEYMIPAHFIWMDDFPKTSSGKIDRKSLPEPGKARPDISVAYRQPRSEKEKQISLILQDVLQLEKIGADDNFFELGGNSLLAQKVIIALKQRHNYDLPITKLYQYPTTSGVVSYLQQKSSPIEKVFKKAERKQPSRDVAVIGMACRFPGANTLSEFWEVLKHGKETISFFSDEELDASIPEHLKKDGAYVKARGIIDDADAFDASFFGINTKLAEAMDPQQRIFLEVAWEALENSGYITRRDEATIGVYAGCGNNTYYLNNVLGNRAHIDQLGDFQVMTVNEKDYIASRTAYHLNLKGPAVSVYSACSTSLLAITQAVESIRNGHCDIALAGGCSLTSPVKSGHIYQEGAIFSKDGHCRTFDADATGTVFSDGAGAIVLKDMEAAVKDGDTIFAVVKGIGVNNDGGKKGSFTAPDAEGQAGAISSAISDAGIAVSSISYIEAHGTATPVGDPIEVEGLKSAFGENAGKQFCALGSVKSNMGHLTAAAGIAGFIKTALSLLKKQIPPSVGFEKQNPLIDLNSSPFYVNTTLADWHAKPRRAGISSFGVGGTNVHVVLEGYANIPRNSAGGRPYKLITWSAKSKESLDKYAVKLEKYLAETQDISLDDIAFSLQTTRQAFAKRRFEVAQSSTDLAEKLLRNTPEYNAGSDGPAEVVFMFPGQGSQYLNMGYDLYKGEPVYRQAIDNCALLLEPYLDTDIRKIMYASDETDDARLQLKNTRYTQPAIFVTEYAMARLWLSWGIEPSVLCGHSVGEFLAAHLAGVFNLEDVLMIVAVRGKMVSELPAGSMLSIAKEADSIAEIIPSGISLAAINSNRLCVVAGAENEIASFSKMLDEKGITNRLLQTSHAFHSSMMDPIVDKFGEVVARVSLARPQKPVVSTVTGTWLTEKEATDPVYWARHLRSPVRFGPALNTILKLDTPLFLEVGPGNVTATFARQQAGKASINILTSMEGKKSTGGDYPHVLATLGKLWLSGLEVNWQSFYAGQHRGRISLPAYAFNKKRCWLDPVTKAHPVTEPSFTQPAGDANTINTRSEYMRKDLLSKRVKEILEEASGIDMQDVSPEAGFLEIGLDSLLLTQLSITLKKEFNLPITFRQLNEEYVTLNLLVDYLDINLPANLYTSNAGSPVKSDTPDTSLTSNKSNTSQLSGDPAVGLLAQQLEIIAKQLSLLQGQQPVKAISTAAVTAIQPVSPVPDITPEEAIELKKPFGATAKIERQVTSLSDKQQTFLQNLTKSYNEKTKSSKTYSQQHRAHMADPRVVSGFRPVTKELVYSIVVNRSNGSRIWDLDGNEYIDVLNGFGSNMFGYQPDFIKKVLHEQIEQGYELGPQHELAGEVSKLICDFTGFDRAALCNTGSEAVLGALRIARTVTARSLVVAFSGSYHGIIDEVLVRGTRKLKSFPAAPGIMPESVQNILILEYGTEESLQIIKDRANELAAVLVEPVQSRRPEFRPVEFLKKLRTITESSGTVLIFDEVITGFRMHPGGAQAMFGIQADLATYGKVIGGGLPIGAIAGKCAYMDALDGGFWQYGDSSVPEIGVTYFAGTFVRHPLALAAAKAALEHMKNAGPGLQSALNDKTERLAVALNSDFEKKGLPFFIAQFGSLWKVKFREEVNCSELIFTLMRLNGVHICDGFPCFITEAHTEEDIHRIVTIFIDSVNEMISAGFFQQAYLDEKVRDLTKELSHFDKAPVPGARLGRDKEGNPSWFVENSSVPGKYLQVDLK